MLLLTQWSPLQYPNLPKRTEGGAHIISRDARADMESAPTGVCAGGGSKPPPYGPLCGRASKQCGYAPKSRPLGGRRVPIAYPLWEEGELVKKLESYYLSGFCKIKTVSARNSPARLSRTFPFLPLRKLAGALLPPRGRLFARIRSAFLPAVVFP